MFEDCSSLCNLFASLYNDILFGDSNVLLPFLSATVILVTFINVPVSMWSYAGLTILEEIESVVYNSIDERGHIDSRVKF